MRNHRTRPDRARGFSLLELITAMTVGAVLVAFAVPSMASFMQSHRLMTAADGLNTALAKARSIAAATNSYVTVAAIDGDWSKGWRVFSEGATPSGSYEPATEKLISHFDPVADVTVEQTKGAADGTYVAYSPVGYSQTATKNQKSIQVVFTLGANKRIVNVSKLGRSRVCDPAREATCTVEED